MCDEHDATESSVSRRAVLVAGAGLGLAALAATSPEAAEAAGYKYSLAGWRFCQKCRGMVFSPKGKSAGVCAAGGKHRPSTPNNYINYKYTGSDQGSAFVQPFAQCNKCTGLVVVATANVVCPKGGTHATGTNPQIQVYRGTEYKPMIDGAWSHCSKCSLVYNWAGGAGGVCPAGGGHARGTYDLGFVVQY